MKIENVRELLQALSLLLHALDLPGWLVAVLVSLMVMALVVGPINREYLVWPAMHAALKASSRAEREHARHLLEIVHNSTRRRGLRSAPADQPADPDGPGCRVQLPS